MISWFGRKLKFLHMHSRVFVCYWICVNVFSFFLQTNSFHWTSFNMAWLHVGNQWVDGDLASLYIKSTSKITYQVQHHILRSSTWISFENKSTIQITVTIIRSCCCQKWMNTKVLTLKLKQKIIFLSIEACNAFIVVPCYQTRYDTESESISARNHFINIHIFFLVIIQELSSPFTSFNKISKIFSSFLFYEIIYVSLFVWLKPNVDTIIG